MPQGAQIWDASGRLIMDVGTLMGRILGVAVLDPGVNSYLTHAAFATGVPFWQLYSIGATANVIQPRVTWTTVSGVKRIVWTWPSTSTTGTSCKLIYGAY